jgi:hypothetical protein
MWRYLTKNELTGNATIDYKTMLLASEYVVKDDRLYRFVLPRGKKKCRNAALEKVVCLPKKYENSVLTDLHYNYGHSSVERLFNMARTYIFIPSLYIACYDVSRSCEVCQQGKLNRSKQTSQLRPWPNFKKGTVIAVDYKDLPRETTEGYRHILVLTEQYSKFVCYEPTKDVKGLTTAKAIIKRVLPLFPNVRLLVSDKATSFKNEIVSSLTKLLGWKHISNAALNSQFNGASERSILDLTRLIALYVPKDELIVQFLPLLEMYQHISVNKSTFYSPHEILFGERPVLNLAGDILKNDDVKPPHEYLVSLKERLRAIQEDVDQNKLSAKIKMKEQYDKRPYVVQEPTYSVGSKVWLERAKPKPRSDKVLTHHPYVGPYYISRIVGNQSPWSPGDGHQIDADDANPGYAYELTACDTGKTLRYLVASKRLKPCKDRTKFNAKHPVIQNQEQNNKWYTIKNIIRKRVYNGVLQFLCRFVENNEVEWCNSEDVSERPKQLFFEKLARQRRRQQKQRRDAFKS